ncbi:MAG: FAD-binding domain-containing protein [Burkholderiaceae bacterium]
MHQRLQSAAATSAANDPRFVPTRAAALDAVRAVDPQRYARTRNFLDGDVTRLSPYITHGLLSVPEVIAIVQSRFKLGWEDKFAFELGWREYFHHVWHHLQDGIWSAQHPAPSTAYAQAMPQDIRQAATGVPVIDSQICHLYRTGYLHNHARMWLASYIVHLRKVDWRAGAAWMYTHLFDGDLASNTLSWQWVAGTWTGKPYLFNADNVTRYGGADSHGSDIDCSYEELDARARSTKVYREPRGATASAEEPAALSLAHIESLASCTAVDAAATAQTPTWVMHPWSLHLPDERPAIGLVVTDFHAAYPWSAARFEFVLAAMRARCHTVWVDRADVLQARLSHMPGLQAIATFNPWYGRLLAGSGAHLHSPPRAFGNPAQLKKSFSSFWNNISKEAFPK